MWLCAETARHLATAHAQGFGQTTEVDFDWRAFKIKRDDAITGLNNAFANHLSKEHVDLHRGWARFVDPHRVEITTTDDQQYTVASKRFCIAVGGSPVMPSVPGIELAINSDGFFALESQPKKVAIVGAGYIAVELAGIFHALGTETHVFLRRDTILRSFDSMLSKQLIEHMSEKAIISRATAADLILRSDGSSLSQELDRLEDRIAAKWQDS